MARATRTGGREATSAVIPGEFVLSIGKPNINPARGFAWYPLGDLARLESGHTPSRRTPEYWDGEIPWIGIRDATANHGRVIDDTAQHVTQLGIDNSSARVLPAGTVCLSRTASVGYVVAMGRPMATSQDFVNWVCGPELDARYLRYLFVSEQQSIRRFAYGSVHPTLYYPDAKALHVCIPELAEQRAIADVLGALDDKIEANRKLAATADDLAVTLFKHHSRGLPLSDLTYADVASVGGGGTPKSKVSEYWGGDVQWLTPTDVTSLPGPYIRQTNRTITEAGLASISSPLYPAGSICMTSRATIGAFALLSVPMAVNQGFIVVQPHDPSLRHWLFHEMRDRVDEFHDHANGATFMELSRGNFKKLRLRLAEPAAMVEFGRRAESLHESARSALRENQRLVEVRDTLLPKLMSGQLRVREAECLVVNTV